MAERSAEHRSAGLIRQIVLAEQCSALRNTIARVSISCLAHFATHPFLKLDDAVGRQPDTGDMEPRAGVERGGVEEAVHDGQMGEEQLRAEHRGDAGEDPAVAPHPPPGTLIAGAIGN